MRTAYLETTVISYLTARPSRDLLVAAHQQVTRDWWENVASRFDLHISVIVMDEISQGDAEAAQKRLAIVEDMRLLQRTPEVDDLAAYYEKELPIPERAMADCYHLALACQHGMDYLVSWNMAHIVSGPIILRLQELNAARGIRTPVICTPEELMEEQ